MTQLISRRDVLKGITAATAAPLLDSATFSALTEVSEVDFFDAMNVITRVHRGLGQIPGKVIFKQVDNINSEQKAVQFLVKFCNVLESMSETFSCGEYKGFLSYDPHEPGSSKRRIELLSRHFNEDFLIALSKNYTALIDSAEKNTISHYSRASRPAINQDSYYAPDYSELQRLTKKFGEKRGTEVYLEKVRKDLSFYSKAVQDFKNLANVQASRFKGSPSSAAQIASRWLSCFSEGKIAEIINDPVFRVISTVTHSSGWEYSKFSTYEKDIETLKQNGISREEVDMLVVSEENREVFSNLTSALRVWDEYILSNKPNTSAPKWLTMLVEDAYLEVRHSIPIHDRESRLGHALMKMLHKAEDILLQGINGGYDIKIAEDFGLRKPSSEAIFQIFLINSARQKGFALLSTCEVVAFIPGDIAPESVDLHLQHLIEIEFKDKSGSFLVQPGSSECDRNIILNGISWNCFTRWARNLAKNNLN